MKIEILLNTSAQLSEEESKLIGRLDSGDFETPIQILGSTYCIQNLSVATDQSGKKYEIKARRLIDICQPKELVKQPKEKDCSNCKHDGNQAIFGTACTGCGVLEEYANFEEK